MIIVFIWVGITFLREQYAGERREKREESIQRAFREHSESIQREFGESVVVQVG
jgi:hypothetical protein